MSKEKKFFKGLKKEVNKYLLKRLQQSKFSIEDFNCGYNQGYHMGIVCKEVKLRNRKTLDLWIDRNEQSDLVICLGKTHWEKTQGNEVYLYNSHRKQIDCEFLGEAVINIDDPDSVFKKKILSILEG